MENLNFGIDKHHTIKANENGGAQCVHCHSPASYNVQPDIKESGDEISVCGYCVHYYRMNELGENDKVVFTAELQAKWISHLQKAIQLAKSSGERGKIQQAEQLEKWLFSHANYVAKSQWGTDNPIAFNAAVERMAPGKRRFVFSELSLALAEETLSVSSIGHDGPPVNSWKDHLLQFKKINSNAQMEEQGSNNA